MDVAIKATERAAPPRRLRRSLFGRDSAEKRDVAAARETSASKEPGSPLSGSIAGEASGPPS
jgi:hypothetical protein